MLIWIQFAAAVVLIGFAGVQLTRYGDAIADKTGMGGTWIGVVLLASVTSLPELATGASSVTVAGVPDIAVGDILGSCGFNLLILVMLDVLNRRRSLFRAASPGHILGAGFGIVLLGVIVWSIVLAETGHTLALGHVGLYSPVLLVLYAVAMRTVFTYETRRVEEFTESEPDEYPDLTLRQIAWRYAAAASVVVVAATWLPFVGEALAAQMGWNESFVGTLFVGFVTSLPEMVVTFAAVRMGAVDMAVGNVFGSNLFNAAIIAVDDLLYTPGPLLADVSPSHGMTGIAAMMMTGVAVVGLLFRPHRIRHVIGWASLALVALYALAVYAQFRYGV